MKTMLGFAKAEAAANSEIARMRIMSGNLTKPRA
jgi:hypothetical protein